MTFTELIPDSLKGLVNSIIDSAQALAKGETALVIGNGAAVIIYLVAKFSGTIPDQTFAEALTQAVAGLAVANAVLVTIRQFVYSPATVAKIVATKPTAAGPQKAAIAEGVVSAADIAKAKAK